LLTRHASEIARLAAPSTLVELGAGTARKTRILLRAWAAHGRARYVPVDICPDVLTTTSMELGAELPAVSVDPLCGTYEQALPRPAAHSPLTLCFLGSSLGNLNPGEQDELFAALAGALTAGDRVLLGLDLVKEPALLEAAYNDAAGVTIAF